MGHDEDRNEDEKSAATAEPADSGFSVAQPGRGKRPRARYAAAFQIGSAGECLDLLDLEPQVGQPGADASHVALMMREELAVSAVGLDEPEPGPVNRGGHEGGEQA